MSLKLKFLKTIYGFDVVSTSSAVRTNPSLWTLGMGSKFRMYPLKTVDCRRFELAT